MDTPKYASNTITKYEMCEVPLVGNFRGKARYDLMTGVMICLGEGISKETNSLLQLLGTLLTKELSPKEKEEQLKNVYGIEVSRLEKERLNHMCNLSELIEERAMEQGIEQGIEKGRTEMIWNMYEMGMSLENIAKVSKLSLEDIKALIDKLQER